MTRVRDGSLREKKMTILATVKSSSNPEKTYNICRGGDGVTYCTCPSWKFKRQHGADRACKHIKAFHAGQLARTAHGTAVETATEAGRGLATATAKMAAGKRANALYRAMKKGGEAAKAAAAEVLADAAKFGYSGNLRAFAMAVQAG